MAEITVRDLDDGVVEVLEARARQRGISLEEEVRAVITGAVDTDRAAFRRELEAIHRQIAAANPEGRHTDSVQIIREQRDAWG